MALPPDGTYKFVVTWFHRDDKQFGDLIVGEANAPSLSAESVQRLFGLSNPESTIAGCHLVTAAEQEALEGLVNIEFDLEKYVYFVEARQTT